DEKMVVPTIEKVAEPVAEAKEEQVIALVVDIEEGQMDVLMKDMEETWPCCLARLMTSRMTMRVLMRKKL
nr:hypothetical protein [Tanacetum cinerariifolium]